MVEKLDIPSTYSEINEAIQRENHEKVLQLSDKLLKQTNNTETEAFSCKVTSLINLGRYDDVLHCLESEKRVKEYLLEYSYALLEKKRYEESMKTLKDNSNSYSGDLENLRLLQAQNYYKMEEFGKSYELLRDLYLEKLKTNSDGADDLLTNLLATYYLSNSTEEISYLTKQLNTWEAFYNYCIICIRRNNFEQSLETLSQMKSFTSDEEFSDIKIKSLEFTIIHHIFDGFDFNRCTILNETYETNLKGNTNPSLMPYFYNNFLHSKKDKDNYHEISKKLDFFLKSDGLFKQEKYVIHLNRIILLLKFGKWNEANESFKQLEPNYEDIRYIMIYCFLMLKTEKQEKVEELANTKFSSVPEVHLMLLQIMLTSLTSKNIDAFHLRVISFVKNFLSYATNFHFINFFINFYQSRHLKIYLKEFMSFFNDPTTFTSKHMLSLVGKTLYQVGLYLDASKYFGFILSDVDKFCKESKLYLINTLSHVNISKSDQIRAEIDDLTIDLSSNNIHNLLDEVFVKFRKQVVKEKKLLSKKRKKKIIYPKNFDPKNPGPMPDPERWIPKVQRKKYKNTSKNKKAYQGGTADNTTTSNAFKK